MKLPITQNGTVDKSKVTNVIKFEYKGTPMIFCLVDGTEFWINYMECFEQWFYISGIYMITISGFPEIICLPETLDFVPSFEKSPSGFKLKI